MSLEKKKTFELSPSGNWVLEGDGFFVSYQPHLTPVDELSKAVAVIAESITGEPHPNNIAETALVGDRKQIGINPYFILNGDFRKEYEGLVEQGWDACYQFWLSQWEDSGSPWSHGPLEVTSG